MAIQATTRPNTLAGREVNGRGRTGSGKTLAFALAPLARTAGQGAESGQRLRVQVAHRRSVAVNQVPIARPRSRIFLEGWLRIRGRWRWPFRRTVSRTRRSQTSTRRGPDERA
ncbi:DEAD/DEAH box helicase [Streptomyces roseus]|uniref:DEAD/DEAH box helicase n=1 Tax=Streptomyces roseus TaxID=66430 RepID=UPI0036C59BBC